MSYQADILSKTDANSFFRAVLFTGAKTQLVVMNIKPGEDIGEETHEHVEQLLFIFAGSGKALLDGQESEIKAGDVVVVTPGTRHNFINTGFVNLKIYTVYSPPNHLEGRVHETKEDAEKDVEDEEFGRHVA